MKVGEKQCSCLSSRIFEDQFTSPCHCSWTATVSRLITEDYEFCSANNHYMYDHVKSVNSVVDVTVKNGLLTDIKY